MVFLKDVLSSEPHHPWVLKLAAEPPGQAAIAFCASGSPSIKPRPSQPRNSGPSKKSKLVWVMEQVVGIDLKVLDILLHGPLG